MDANEHNFTPGLERGSNCAGVAVCQIIAPGTDIHFPPANMVARELVNALFRAAFSARGIEIVQASASGTLSRSSYMYLVSDGLAACRAMHGALLSVPVGEGTLFDYALLYFGGESPMQSYGAVRPALGIDQFSAGRYRRGNASAGNSSGHRARQPGPSIATRITTTAGREMKTTRTTTAKAAPRSGAAAAALPLPAVRFPTITTVNADGTVTVRPGRPEIDPQEITPREAAALLRVSKPTVYRFIDEGRLRCRRPSRGKILILESDVKALRQKSKDPEYWLRDKRGRGIR
jgi:excisionase family DNA binding protein